MEHFEHFIQRENIAIFKRRLAETKDASIRGVLLKLLAEEQAKDVTPKSEKEGAPAGGLVHLKLTQGRRSANPPGTNVSGLSW